MAFQVHRQPLIGHGLIVAMLLGSIGAARIAYVDPKLRELSVLQADRIRISTQLTDLQKGIQEMEQWAKDHPGEDLLTFRARRAMPAREMVSKFLDALGDIADKNHVRTVLIQPAGELTSETVSDAAGNPVAYRKADLRFHLYAGYRDMGEYLREIESMDQLVVVRSIGLRYDAATYPALVADVTIWLYGTP